MKKKLLALLIAIVTVFTCMFAFTACSDVKSGNDTNKTESGNNTEDKADDDKKEKEEFTIIGSWKTYAMKSDNGGEVIYTYVGDELVLGENLKIELNDSFCSFIFRDDNTFSAKEAFTFQGEELLGTWSWKDETTIVIKGEGWDPNEELTLKLIEENKLEFWFHNDDYYVLEKGVPSF